MALSRRTLLLASAAAAGVATAGAAPATAKTTTTTKTTTDKYPFTLGIASGDPDHEGFVLWTRLAVNPLAEDGLGGMPDRTMTVQWQVAADERFRHIVRAGVALARPQQAHTVHVELGGFAPG